MKFVVILALIVAVALSESVSGSLTAVSTDTSAANALIVSAVAVFAAVAAYM